MDRYTKAGVIFMICFILLVVGVGIYSVIVQAKGNVELMPDVQYGFKWAIVDLGNGELLEGPVKSWRDFGDEGCVQFTFVDGPTILTHYSNVILCSEQP